MAERLIQIFGDTADLDAIRRLRDSGAVSGFTTNPTLMRRAGVTDYESWAWQVLEIVPDMPVSLQVIASGPNEIKQQARKIAGWGPNVYAKVPIMSAEGWSNVPVIRELAAEGIRLNVTAVLSERQAVSAIDALGSADSYLSVFAGRIADAGANAAGAMHACRNFINAQFTGICGPVKLLWASARQAYSVIEAETARCDAISMSPELIDKLPLRGKDLEEFSRETVAMFQRDAAGILL